MVCNTYASTPACYCTGGRWGNIRPLVGQANIPDALLQEPELGLEDDILKDYQQVAQNLFDRLGDSQAELTFLQAISSLPDNVLHLETAMRFVPAATGKA